MPKETYKCNSCLKSFTVKYIFTRPDKVNCPHCDSPLVQPEKNTGCGCGDKKGFRFT